MRGERRRGLGCLRIHRRCRIAAHSLRHGTTVPMQRDPRENGCIYDRDREYIAELTAESAGDHTTAPCRSHGRQYSPSNIALFTMVPGPFTNVLSRLKRVAAFVGIVWAVAASFIAFELASLAGFNLLLATGAGRALALPNAVRASTACTVSPSEHSGSLAQRPGDNVGAAAWLLGVKVGMHAQMSQWLVDQSPRTGVPAAQWATVCGRTHSRPNTRFSSSRHFCRCRNRHRSSRRTARTRTPPSSSRSKRIPMNRSPHCDHLRRAAVSLIQGGGILGYAMMVRMALPGEGSVFSASK